MSLAAIVLCSLPAVEDPDRVGDRPDFGALPVVAPVDILIVVTDSDGASDPVAAAQRAFPASGAATLVAPGSTRQVSLTRALAALPAEVDVVLVLTGDRRSADPGAVPDIVSAVRAGAQAVVPVVPLADTVKQVSDTGELLSTVDRSVLRVVQTPQGFDREALARAVAGVDPAADDDEIALDEIALFDRLGMPVRTVSGHHDRAGGGPMS